MSHKEKISSFSVIIVFCMLMIIGACFIPLLNVQLNPSNRLPQTYINYYWNNASARVIEQEITTPLEGVLGQLKGVRNISSVSGKGSGSITIEFDKNTNVDALRFELSTMIRQVYPKLPEGVSYPSVQMRNTDDESKGAILTYTINGSASPILIQEYAEKHIVPKIAMIPGVNSARVYGGTPFEWLIEINTAQINQLGIGASEISSIIRDHFSERIIGLINVASSKESGIQPMRVMLQLGSENAANWDAIPLKKVGERMVYLKDVCSIKYQEQPPSSYHRINGLNSINIVISPEASVNNLKLAKTIKKEVQLIKNQLDEGYHLILVNDTTQFIVKELSKIAWRTLFSIFILLVFVILVTRRWRYLFLILVSILANLLIAAMFYYLFKIEIHLYALAGITVSFGMMVDNSIVMIDHLRLRGNKRVFLAILAATLTTIGALSVIFFLKESQRLNLVDFSLVIIINLSISIVIALFFIPALLEKLPLGITRGKGSVHRKKLIVKFNQIYNRNITFSKRYAWMYILLLVLGFGIPIHWLPDKLDNDNAISKIYMQTLGAEWFVQKAKPVLSKFMGGSLRLFTENVFQSSYYSEPSRTVLYVRGTMPEGCTVQQLNEVIQKMEAEIAVYKEIETFQTTIWNAQNGRIQIEFTDSAEFTGFPYFLKEELTSKAIQYGGVDWNIAGVGRGFSNALGSAYKSVQYKLEGYNYDQLYSYAMESCENLKQFERVKELEITGPNSYNDASAYEYYLDFDAESFAVNNVTLRGFYGYLYNKLYRNSGLNIFFNKKLQAVNLISTDYNTFHVWNLNNEPIWINNKLIKLPLIGGIEKRKTGNNIHKNNQQYQLGVSYSFLGSSQLAKIIKEREIERIKKHLPIGYQVMDSNNFYNWNRNDKGQYYLLLLVIAIIYFICAILLESLTQPLAIIGMIPISFIGVFLTFYLFDINFDQGGFASFIMLCGISVNSGLYILNDYNQMLRTSSRSSLQCYVNAFNHKIMPIMLTILSTILGLIPFIWNGQNEVFWFSFASGAIGGLVFSVIGLFIYLPLMMKMTLKNK